MPNDNGTGAKEKQDASKPSTNSPSYLIWSIFTKQRELEKARVLRKKNHTSEGNTEIHYNTIQALL